jgi:hypothetical protein
MESELVLLGLRLPIQLIALPVYPLVSVEF